MKTELTSWAIRWVEPAAFILALNTRRSGRPSVLKLQPPRLLVSLPDNYSLERAKNIPMIIVRGHMDTLVPVASTRLC
jgi:hypothetical protein